VTASQTFKAGDWVLATTDGTLSIAAAASNDVGNVAVIGIAQADAADVLADSDQFPYGCPVLCPDESGEFVAAVYHGTAASAKLAATDIDPAASTKTLPLRNQGGQWVVNLENNGTNDRVVVMERHPAYPFDEVYGWFWCKLKPGSRQEAAS
jgi:hypothetical protein